MAAPKKIAKAKTISVAAPYKMMKGPKPTVRPSKASTRAGRR